ncbi:hypothetical protein ACA910_006904 [Epithemia clementina (nom. ined.)]
MQNHKQRQQESAPVHGIVGFKIGLDVMCRKGEYAKRVNEHYRFLIRQFYPAYACSISTTLKRLLADEICKIIHQRGGRFINGTSKQELAPDKCRSKVMKALKDYKRQDPAAAATATAATTITAMEGCGARQIVRQKVMVFSSGSTKETFPASRPDAKTGDMASAAGSYLVLNSTLCPPCGEETKSLNRNRNKNQEPGACVERNLEKLVSTSSDVDMVNSTDQAIEDDEGKNPSESAFSSPSNAFSTGSSNNGGVVARVDKDQLMHDDAEIALQKSRPFSDKQLFEAQNQERINEQEESQVLQHSLKEAESSSSSHSSYPRLLDNEKAKTASLLSRFHSSSVCGGYSRQPPLPQQDLRPQCRISSWGPFVDALLNSEHQTITAANGAAAAPADDHNGEEQKPPEGHCSFRSSSLDFLRQDSWSFPATSLDAMSIISLAGRLMGPPTQTTELVAPSRTPGAVPAALAVVGDAAEDPLTLFSCRSPLSSIESISFLRTTSREWSKMCKFSSEEEDTLNALRA